MNRPIEQQFPIVSNFPCLDLVNTQPVQHGQRTDTLREFSDVVAWLSAAGVLSEREKREADTRWAGTADGEAVFAAAIELRTALRTMAERMVAGKSVGDATVDVINRCLTSGLRYRRLIRDGLGFKTELVPPSAEPIHLLVPVAESASDLLEHGDPALIKQCENPSCVLYFYDTTKNRSRRWCSMEACGSRIKAAAYYRRTRGSLTKAGGQDSRVRSRARAPRGEGQRAGGEGGHRSGGSRRSVERSGRGR